MGAVCECSVVETPAGAHPEMSESASHQALPPALNRRAKPLHSGNLVVVGVVADLVVSALQVLGRRPADQECGVPNLLARDLNSLKTSIRHQHLRRRWLVCWSSSRPVLCVHVSRVQVYLFEQLLLVVRQSALGMDSQQLRA